MNISRSKTLALVAGAMAVLLTSACSGPGVGETDLKPMDSVQVEEARKVIEPYFAVPAFKAPGPPVEAAAAKGKTVFTIIASSTIPFLEAVNTSMRGVAEKAGLKYVDYPNQGQTQQWSQGVEQAISTRADLIVLLGAPNPELLQPQLTEAKRAGIPVLVAYLYADGSPLPANVDALVTVPSHKHMSLVVDYALANSQEPVNALFLVAREFNSTAGMEAAAVKELEARCGAGCKHRVVDVPAADWGTKIPTSVQSALIADPGINWVIPIYDGMASGAISGITLAGANDRVRIATADASLFALKNIQAGNVIAEDGGTSADWIAWANIDQSLRLLTGAQPVVTENLPIRMFDKTNIHEVGTPPVQNQGWGDAYIAGYSKLWGIS